MGPFLAILGRGRHSRGSADPVGSIWRQYRAKRRHGDLFQTIFDKIQPETVKSGPRLPSVESGPRLSSVESGPRLPSEKSGQVAAAAAVVAAAGALAPAGAPASGAMAGKRGQAALAPWLGMRLLPAPKLLLWAWLGRSGRGKVMWRISWKGLF